MTICDDYGIPHSEFLSWSEEDQDKAIAFRLHKAKHCSRCGTSQEEWEENRYAYYPEVNRCRGCEMREQQEEAVQQEKGSKAGLYVVLKPASTLTQPA